MRRLSLVEKLNVAKFLVGCGIFFSFLVACSGKVAQLTPDLGQDGDVPEAYLLGPEDVLEIVVWKNSTLSKIVTVRPDGRISLPLIGDIQAADLTAVQLKDDISEKLKPYYKESPEVSVIVQQVNSYIYVLGEVQRPGKQVVKSGTTVIQAIASSGGLTQYASPNNILLLRKGSSDNDGNKELVMKIRYKDITSGKDLKTNFLVKTGDTIIVN